MLGAGLRRLVPLIIIAAIVGGGATSGGATAAGSDRAETLTIRAPRWQAGRYWQFDVRSKTTRGVSLERLTHTVLDAKRIKGARVYALVSTRRTRSAAPLGAEVSFVSARDFVALDLGRDRRWYLVNRLWDFPLRPGMEYAYGRDVRGKNLRAKVGKVSSVRTSAGTFRAVSVRRGDSRGRVTTWFAPRAGFDVKVQSNGLSAKLARTGRHGAVAGRVFLELGAILKAGDQSAKLSLVASLGRLARAGMERRRAAAMLNRLASDPDLAVEAAARGELNALAGRTTELAPATLRRRQAAAQDPVTIGEIIGILTTVWDFADKAKALSDKKSSVEIKRPESLDRRVELGTTVTVPWEIDYTTPAWNWGDFWDRAHYSCHFEVSLDGAVFRREVKACDSGLDQRTEELLAVVAKRWECGKKHDQKVEVKARITRWYPVYKWEFGWTHANWRKVGDIEETVAGPTSSLVRFNVYNPFFLSHFSLDPANHTHDQSLDMAIRVKARKRLDFENPPNSDGWFFDKLNVGTPWTYSGFVLGDWLVPSEQRHHDTQRLEPRTTSDAEVQWDLTSTHVGGAGDHPDRKEAWRAVAEVKGTRNLGAQEGPAKVPVEWKGELLDEGLESGKCSKDLEADDY